jgi:hypothetical protein
MWCKCGVNIHHSELRNVAFMRIGELKMYNILETYYVYQITPYNLDFLTNDKIATLQAENNDLRRAASQDRQNALLTTTMAAQTNQIIDAVRPTPVPSFPASNLYGYAYGCGCNTGCGC